MPEKDWLAVLLGLGSLVGIVALALAALESLSAMQARRRERSVGWLHAIGEFLGGMMASLFHFSAPFLKLAAALLAVLLALFVLVRIVKWMWYFTF